MIMANIIAILIYQILTEVLCETSTKKFTQEYDKLKRKGRKQRGIYKNDRFNYLQSILDNKESHYITYRNTYISGYEVYRKEQEKKLFIEQTYRTTPQLHETYEYLIDLLVNHSNNHILHIRIRPTNISTINLKSHDED